LPQNFSLQAHVGYNTGSYWNKAGDEPLDYSIGLGYTYSHFNIGVKWVDTSTSIRVPCEGENVFCNEGRLIATVATTFPWKSE
jgi:hypothetical protein